MNRDPMILRETSNGFSRYTLQDSMLQQRSVFCFGEINASLVDSLILQLIHLAQESDEEITMYIHSPGGEVNSGLALFDAMKALPCPIRTVCMGQASSMAAVLFASGDRRDILEHSHVMIHDPLSVHVSGSALQIKSYADSILKLREIMADIMSKCTGKPLEDVLEKTGAETIFSAHEAVEYGLADRVVTCAEDFLPKPVL